VLVVVLISRQRKGFNSCLPDSFLEISRIPAKPWKTKGRDSGIAGGLWKWDMAR